MNNEERKQHWEKIYRTKSINEVSWYQPVPETSLHLFEKYQVAKNAKIIDVGGGDSFLVDNLLGHGYTDITVLDISEAAIEKAKTRLGSEAEKVKWIVSDITNFEPSEIYDLWHDRATFHFLTEDQEVTNYVKTVQQFINTKGILIIGTFSEQGPKKCSGIEIRQYSEISMNALFRNDFKILDSFTTNHNTPFGTIQNFIFCCFERI